MHTRSIAVILVITLSGLSWSQADELEELYGTYVGECIERAKAAQREEALDPSQADFRESWIARLSEAVEAHVDSPVYERALRDLAGMLVWSGRAEEAIPYHDKLIELARTPEEIVHEMNQLAHTLIQAAQREKSGEDSTQQQHHESSLAWEAISQLEAVIEYLEDTGLAVRAGYQEWISGTMQRQAEMYTLVEEHSLAGDMYAAAYERFPLMSRQSRESLGWGPSGQFMLVGAVRSYARSGQSSQALYYMDRLLEIRDRRAGIGSLWGQLLELNEDAYYDAALAWLLSVPDIQDGPTNAMRILLHVTKNVRQDHALAYELLMLQLDHYSESLSDSTLEKMHQQEESWRRDAEREEGETADDDLESGVEEDEGEGGSEDGRSREVDEDATDSGSRAKDIRDGALSGLATSAETSIEGARGRSDGNLGEVGHGVATTAAGQNSGHEIPNEAKMIESRVVKGDASSGLDSSARPRGGDFRLVGGAAACMCIVTLWCIIMRIFGRK